MAARKLAVTVHVTNPETGAIEVFRPGDDVPGWAANAITNPDVWAGSDRASDSEATDEVAEGASSEGSVQTAKSARRKS